MTIVVRKMKKEMVEQRTKEWKLTKEECFVAFWRNRNRL